MKQLLEEERLLREQERLQQQLQETRKQQQLHRQQQRQQAVALATEQKQKSKFSPAAAHVSGHPPLDMAELLHREQQLAELESYEEDQQHYPPLLKRFSWTMAAPFKEERYHRAVSDSIANNYSPRASQLNLANISKRMMVAPVAGGTQAVTFDSPHSPRPFLSKHCNSSALDITSNLSDASLIPINTMLLSSHWTPCYSHPTG